MSRIQTHKDYVLKLAEKNNNLEVIGTYIDTKTSITHRCKVCGNIFDVKPCNALGGYNVCKRCAEIHKEQQREQYEDLYIRRLSEMHPNIMLTEQYINANQKTTHICTICGYEWKPKPSQLLDERYIGCPVCSGCKIGPAPEYKNSILASEYKEYFSKYMTENQMKLYAPNSRHWLDFVCPDCGNVKHMRVGTLLHYGFGCICKDGHSFPNKFVYNVLCQLQLRIKTEYSPKWACHKRYDSYLLDYNIIIENHGMQHYKESGFPNIQLNDVINNDKIKYNLALQNGISKYIILDCRESTTKWIKSSIMNSDLPKILGFTESDIDWVMAYKYAETNLIKEALNMINDGYTIDDVSEKFGVTKYSVRKWLKKAEEVGIC
jgi:rubrerythrin